MSIVLAPVAGRLTDRVHPRILAGAGLAVLATSLVLLASVISADTPLWQVLGAMALLGVGSSFVWAPLTTTANRNLPLHQAGAGAGIYNANRQIGSVVGAAAIAVLIDSRLAANGLSGGGVSEASLGGTLPAVVRTRSARPCRRRCSCCPPCSSSAWSRCCSSSGPSTAAQPEAEVVAPPAA